MSTRPGTRAFVLACAAAWTGFSVSAAGAGGDAIPTVTNAVQITGTPDMFFPGGGIANLDAGDLVCGSTRWDNDGDGIVFLSTYVGYLWSPSAGATVFTIGEDLYWNPNIQGASEIADNGVVVGTDLFREDFRNLPFVWSRSTGFGFLPCTEKGGNICMGFTTAVSSDGSVAVGAVSSNVIPGQPTRAARWTMSFGNRPRFTLKELDAPDTWSNAWDISADGNVVVGDLGPDESTPSPVRWIKGKRDMLASPGDAGSAAFTSVDGRHAIGWASDSGRKVLVRWDDTGAATVFDPPDGCTIETINAVNRDATAAVGAVSQGGNWSPYVWTLADGFVVIPENGREADYDASDAWDVSDDGNSVVGYLGATVVSNGDPPTLAFLWRRSTGLLLVNDLMANYGYVDPDFYFATAISGDGLRLVVDGNLEASVHDANALLLTLSNP